MRPRHDQVRLELLLEEGFAGQALGPEVAWEGEATRAEGAEDVAPHHIRRDHGLLGNAGRKARQAARGARAGPNGGGGGGGGGGAGGPERLLLRPTASAPDKLQPATDAPEMYSKFDSEQF
eukprot:tig00020902_g14988.t1